MKVFNALLVGVSCVFLLSACSLTAPKSKSTATAQSGKSSASARGSYVTRTSPFFDGIVIASTNNQCIDQFNFIKGTNLDTYKNYSTDYSKIGDGYRFLNINQNIMGREAKEVYTMQLDMKLDTLCSKVHYTSFQIVKEKMKVLARI
ncbi:MAG: hypothetical protein ACRCWW_09325 [Scandinavium sp.]|uniref:hypothetical protein n=1 Tax=Scandinavium sp. TaxID=2830653 RepID=UPI003F3F0C32